MKKNRLVVTTPSSDGQWWYAGGPDLDDAMKGLANLIREDIRQMLSPSQQDEPIDSSEFSFAIREMTDEEVAAMPEL